MRFQVPQYIEVEDKIFGPLTLKQFIFIAGSVGIAVILFSVLPKFLAILISIPIIALGAALAFMRINNQPFISVMEAFFKYYIGGRLYIWRKEEKKVVKKGEKEIEHETLYVPKLSDSKLKDLSWSLGVKKSEAETIEKEKTN